MSKVLFDQGAETVAGRVYLNRVHVATHTKAGLELTEAGQLVVATAPAEVKPKPAKKTAAKKPPAQTEDDKPPAQTEDPEIDDILDSL